MNDEFYHITKWKILVVVGEDQKETGCFHRWRILIHEPMVDESIDEGEDEKETRSDQNVKNMLHLGK